MRGKIAVVGLEGSPVTGELGDGGRVEVVAVDAASFAEAAGADVVVLGVGADVAAAAGQVARRAPGAVVLVATADPEGDCAAALAASLLPRPRVVGVPAGDVVRAAEAVLYGRATTLQAAVLCRGELGIEDRVATVPATLGRGGVTAIGTPPGA